MVGADVEVVVVVVPVGVVDAELLVVACEVVTRVDWELLVVVVACVCDCVVDWDVVVEDEEPLVAK